MVNNYLKNALISALKCKELEINHCITMNNLKNKKNMISYFIIGDREKEIYRIMHLSVLAGPQTATKLLLKNIEFHDLIGLEEILQIKDNSFLKLAEENFKKGKKELAELLIKEADSYLKRNKLNNLENNELYSLYSKKKTEILETYKNH